MLVVFKLKSCLELLLVLKVEFTKPVFGVLDVEECSGTTLLTGNELGFDRIKVDLC